MSSISLTSPQRLNLANVLSGKRHDSDSDAELVHGVLERIRLTKDQLRQITRPAPTLEQPDRGIIDIEKLGELPTVPFEFEKAEASKVLEILLKWRDENNLSADDVEWYIPLKKDLESAKSGEKTK